MISRNWTAIERLPERPGVAIMTGTGYWLDGEFHPTKTARVPIHRDEPRKPSLFNRIWGGGRG